MEAQFSRNFPILSEDEQAVLKSSHVFIAGAGGLGGYLLEFMVRLGIGSVTICDGDSFSVTNLNRQLLSTSENLGRKKVFVAEKHALEINPALNIKAVPEFITKNNAARLIEGSQVVLDGLDNPDSRKLLYAKCEEAGIPYIYGAVSGYTSQAAVLFPGSRLLDSLHPPGIDYGPPGVLSFTPALTAAMEAALCLKLLCGRPFEDNRLYCADLFNMDFQDFLF